MGISPRQIGWSNESNLLWQISKQMDNLTNVTSTSLSTIIADLATKVTNQQGVPSFRADTLANLPVAGQTGRMFVATDTYAFYRDNGLGWDLIGGPGIGTVTGSGTATQVAFWNGTSVISGSNNLFWDNANSRLGIGTSSPAYKLDVLSSTTTIAKFTGATNAYVDFTDGIVNTRLQNSGGLLFGTTTNHDLTLRTNAASRLTITSGGNVGIATTTPQTQLDIANGLMFGTIDAFPSATYDAAAVIAKTGSLGSAPFNNAGSIVYRARVTSTAGRSSHIFYTGSPSTERMRLNESGNLGLGVTPSAWSIGKAFEINSAGNAIWSYGTENLYLSSNAYFNGGWKYGGSGKASNYTQFQGQHFWEIAGTGTAGNAISFTTAMTLDASGRLGIGLTNPAQRFVVRGQNGNSALEFDNKASNTEIVSYDRVASAYRDLYLHTSSASPTMVLNTSGNVGIGTTSPAQQLEIKGAAGANTTIQITSNNSNDFSSRIFFADNVSQRGYIAYSNFSNFLAFGTNSAEVARFTSAGELLINTTTDVGDFKLQVSGNAYVSGSVGIGSTSTSNGLLTIAGTAPRAINMAATFTGGTSRFGILQNNTVNSDVTSSAVNNYSQFATQAAAFTLTTASHYTIAGITIGAGSSVTNQIGYRATNITEATNNYGFYGEIASGTGRWNLYMAGTADNYLAGSLGIGSTSLTGYTLRLGKTMTGSTVVWGIQNGGIVQSDVTNTAIYFNTAAATQATAFTLTNLYHYGAGLSSIGAGSSITNQYGYFADNTLVGATNNYGFYGNIASGTGRWNLYMNGTANNYMNGNLGIGVTTPTEKLEVNGAIKTAAPSGGTAKPFKIGAAAVVTPTSPNRTIEIEIDGTTYYLTAKTTND